MILLFETVLQGLLNGSGYALTAVGMAIIFNVSGMLNFAHGDYISLFMYFCLALLIHIGIGPYLSSFAVVPLATIIGVATYWFLMRPLQSKHLLMVVQLTLGLSFIIQNLVLLMFGSQEVMIQSAISSDLITVSPTFSIRAPTLVAGVCSLAIIALLYLLIQRSDFGRSMRAIHQDPTGAIVCGINVDLVRVFTFALAFGVMAIAACLMAPTAPIQPQSGLMLSIMTILVLILGGLGNYYGVLVGGLVVGVSQTIGTVYLPGTLGLTLPYIIFVLVLLLRPNGILERRPRA